MAKGGGPLPEPRWIQSATEMTFLGVNQPPMFLQCLTSSIILQSDFSIDLFPGLNSHHPVFDRLQYAKTKGEGLVQFITWMTSVSTMVDRGGEGSPVERRNLHEVFSCSFHSKCWSFERTLSEKHTTPGSKWRTHVWVHYSNGVIHVIKWTTPSSPIFAHCKQSKT